MRYNLKRHADRPALLGIVAVLCLALLSACDVAARAGIELGIKVVGEVIGPPIRDSFTQPDTHAVRAIQAPSSEPEKPKPAP